jgi:hypothetical protein
MLASLFISLSYVSFVVTASATDRGRWQGPGGGRCPCLSRRSSKNVVHVLLLDIHCKDTIPKIRNKYSQKRHCAALVLISTFMCLWAIYIFPWSACLFCWRKICGPILGLYKSLTDTWMWKLETETAQFLFWKYTNGTFVAVYSTYYMYIQTRICFQKGIAQLQSQFPHSCVCEQFIHSHDRSACSAEGKYVDRSWDCINRSQTHECGNWKLRPRNSFSGNTQMGLSLQCTVHTKCTYRRKYVFKTSHL